MSEQSVRFVVRPAALADVEPVLELWRRAGAVPSVTDDEESLRRLLEHPDSRLLLVEADGELVGSAVAGWDGWRGAIYRLAVDPAWRRRGVASLLVREAEALLRRAGAKRIGALVIEQDAIATGFWRATGYELDSRIVRFVRSSTAAETERSTR